MRNRRIPVFALILVLLGAPLRAWSAWEINLFNGPAGASQVQLWDVNDAGQIVGNTEGGAFLYDHGIYTWFSDPTLAVTGISNDGQTFVGNTFDSVTGVTRGWVSRNGVTQLVDPTGVGVFTGLRHVSADGRFAVGTSDADFSAFVYTTTSGAIAPLSLPIGVSPSVIQGVNDEGWVSGSVIVGGSGRQRGLLYNVYTQESQIYSSLPGFTGSVRFRDINESGLIAGSVGTEGFVGSFATGFEHINVPGAIQTFVYGVNNAGLLVGWYQVDDTGTTFAFTATQVPEPTQALLLLAGLCVIFKARRARAA